MAHEGKTFQGETIRLDNEEYANCTFVDCDLQYGGAGFVGFSNCKFDRCRWSFVDAASNTLRFMASLYHGLGGGGRNLIEDLFRSIRQNPPPGMDPQVEPDTPPE
jgi:hypothetical protein